MRAVNIYSSKVVITFVVAVLVIIMAFDPRNDHSAANNCAEMPMLDINSQGEIAGRIYVKSYCG